MNAHLCQFCDAGSPALSGLPACGGCHREIASALETLPELLAALEAATPRTLARPARETPGAPRPRGGPSSPAHETLLDLRAELIATVRAWAALLRGRAAAPPARLLTRHLGAALAVPGGPGQAARLLYLADTARRRLDPPEVIRVREPCPECATRALVQYDTGGPCWCTYCHAEVYPAA